MSALRVSVPVQAAVASPRQIRSYSWHQTPASHPCEVFACSRGRCVLCWTGVRYQWSGRRPETARSELCHQRGWFRRTPTPSLCSSRPLGCLMRVSCMCECRWQKLVTCRHPRQPRIVYSYQTVAAPPATPLTSLAAPPAATSQAPIACAC